MPPPLRVPISPLQSGDLVLDDATARYVTRVHRFGDGDRFVAFDPESRTEADVEILATGRDVRVAIGAVRGSQAVARAGLVLLQAIGKGDKPEDVVRAAAVLGVEHVVFVESRRAVVRVGDRAEARRKRWHAVAVEAARQSGRGDTPRISGPVPLTDAFALVSEGARARRIYLSPRSELGLAEALLDLLPDERLVVVIGPEGGFDDEEEAALASAGFVAASLGRFVMRTEIATIATLGAIAALIGSKPSR